VSQAETHLRGLRTFLGLGIREGLVARGAFTNLQGQALVRLEHTFDGARVWGSQAVVRVDPEGGFKDRTQGLRSGVEVQGRPRLRAEEAAAIVLKRFAGGTPFKARPHTELVVFPSRFVGGLATTVDPATGQTVLDRRSVVHAKPSTPFLWAYEVRTGRHDTPMGPEELDVLVDATTGNLLRVTNGMEAAAPTPATGTGTGFYRGAVSLATSQMADGTFSLYDTTRGTLPNPDLSQFTPDGSGWSPTGLQAWYEEHDAAGNSTYNTFLFQSNAVNTWGDGQPFTQWGSENGPNGQSTGVDAMSAMASTWDFFKQVFGRDGLDGQGTSTMAYTLLTSPFYIDNAWWSIGGHSAYLGVGSYPANPKGLTSHTDLDVVAHEMTHGLTSPNWSQVLGDSPGLEEAGVNEATGDFFAQMVKAHAGRPAGAPDGAIPDTGTDWQIGAGINHGTPLRRMDKPSLDQRSRDGWHDGIAYMDGHYSSGPINRALYFLSQGSSNHAGDTAYSPYLPNGMTGIGNDSAARIWYKTMTEGFIGDGTGSLTMADARQAALDAADELFGAGSAESIAVENAFAAANIGDGHGQAPRTLVRFADWRNGDWIETSHPFIAYANRQIFPKGETVRPRITVEHNANTAVTWSIGGPSMFNGGGTGTEASVEEGGTINPDGSWTTPDRLDWHAITATSQADPNQLAEGRVYLINMDMDQDLEQDALDMAGIAFSWGFNNAISPAHSVFEALWVDDSDAAFFVDAMKAAWPAQ
jgi:Zn-dependent metalloprotease